jgi:sigma-B regulation protein RsbU (phosphoserine phosphatase)
VKQLGGLLPICCYCKSIRNDQNYWERVEVFVTEHSNAKFTHGICPSCYEAAKAQLSA